MSTVPMARRIEVALIEGADQALEAEKRASGMTRTDVVNRAIQLYHPLAFELRQGNEILIRNPENGTTFKYTIAEVENGGAPAGAPTLTAKVVAALAAAYDIYFDGSGQNGPLVEFDERDGGLVVTGSVEAVSEFLVCVGHAIAEAADPAARELAGAVDGFDNARVDIVGDRELAVFYPNFRLPVRRP